MAQTVTIGEQKVCPESESLKFSTTPTPQVENPSDSTALVPLFFCFIYLFCDQLCSRCGKVVILYVFKTGINAVSFLPVFQAAFLVFLTAQWRLRHTGSARVFDYALYRRTQARLLCIFAPPPTVPLQKVVNSDSFLWTVSLSAGP